MGGFSSNMSTSLKNNKALRGRKPFNRDRFTPLPVYSKQKQKGHQLTDSFRESNETRKSSELKKLIGYLTVIIMLFVVLFVTYYKYRI